MAVMKLIYFLFYAAMASWSIYFYVFLEEERGLSGMQIGVLAALQQVTNILVLPLWGMISDRYGKRKIFLVLLGISVFLFYGFLVNGDFYYYVGFIFVFVILQNPIGALIDSFAIAKTKEKYIFIPFGKIRLWGSAGWTISSFATGYVVENSPIEIIFIIASSILVAIWIVSFLFLNKKHELKSEQAPSFYTLKSTLWGEKKLFYFFILIMVYYVLNAPTLTFINLYYKEIGGDNMQIGIAFAIQSLFELPFMFYANRILTRFGIRRVIIATMLVAAVRMLLYGLTNEPYIAIGIGVLHGITLGLFIVAATEYVHILVAPSQITTAQTLMYSFLGLGTSAGNYICGVMKDSIGLQNGMTLNASLVFALILIVYLVLFFKKNKSKIVPKIHE